MAAPFFTVFTPTYNRAHTLHRVFDSLRVQTLRDFEWLVVDDGSTDDTAKQIAIWVEGADFPIRYFKQAHSGKHIAHNLAAREARGKFFLPLDSDDACPPSALERMAYHWETIPSGERTLYSGVDGLCSDQHGDVVGDKFPSEPFDTTLRERSYVYRLRGEKWGSTLTEIVRRHPFPDVVDTEFIPEGTVWLEIGKTYKNRCVNEIFRIYYVGDDQAGATLTSQRGFGDNASGRLHYYLWLLNNDLEYFLNSPRQFLKAAFMLPIVAHLSGQPLWRSFCALRTVQAKALLLAVLPASLVTLSLRRLCHKGRALELSRR